MGEIHTNKEQVAEDPIAQEERETQAANSSIKEPIKPRAKALLPILVFLVFYLGCGVYFEYIAPIEGQMGFYVVSVVVALCIGLVVAFLQNRSLHFENKIQLAAKGIGDPNIAIMLFIFLAAGAFSGIASAAGGTESTANMFLSVVPPNLVVPGFFLIACIISLAMGTSVGTITVLVPIVVPVAEMAGISLPLCVGSVVGGAMFGDNLSFISDTTIAATRTQGVSMKDKFWANLPIALPAALVTIVILAVISSGQAASDIGSFEFNPLLALPYFAVLIISMCGINVFVALGIGIVLFGVAGAFAGTLTFTSAFLAMGSGTSGMFETMVVAVLVSAMSALVSAYGGFEAMLLFVKRVFHGKRGGMLGVGLFTLAMDIATANNTVAIVVAAPIAKQMSYFYDLEPKRVASLLDVFSCIGQGVIPYGAQMLVAASLSGLSAMQIVPYSCYQALLLVSVLVFILGTGKGKARTKKLKSEPTA